jgi:UDP-N-acetylmuramoylalanine--D-glutamate ligase
MSLSITRPEDLRGRRVLLLGLGVNQGGLGVARFLAEHGADVRVTDLQTQDALAGPLAELEGLPITYTLGRHEESDFEWAEIVVRNPAVPRDSTWLDLARRHGAQVEMEMTLFFRLCHSPIIGVTGTKGKTTTTAILGEILQQRWPDVILAGNMGRTALGQIKRLRPDEPVALELSSFQLESLDEQRMSPQIAVWTNISEDHLDRYASLDDYAAVKASIARHQSSTDWIIYPRGDDGIATLLAGAEGIRATFGTEPVSADHALWIDGQRFVGRWSGDAVDLGQVEGLSIPGRHNVLNALAAAAAGLAGGLTPREVTAGIAAARSVENRLETIATIGGVEYVNDTTATTPAATVAALATYQGRQIVLIAGGSNKRVSLGPLADAIAARADRVVLLDGTATADLMRELAVRGFDRHEGPYSTMKQAVAAATDRAAPGAVVLLSPGCASFGMFRNEFHRGDTFRQAVAELALEETV